nr:EOG090X0C5Y [Ceriodaphnia reticulata]
MLRQLLRFNSIRCFKQCNGNRNLHDPAKNTVVFPDKSAFVCIEKPQDSVNEQIPSCQENNNPLLPDSSFVGVSPVISPSFNLANYVNKSELLQNLVKLGVSIHQWEKLGDVHSWLMVLDFTKDVKPIIQFLVDQGVSPNQLGIYFTKNPYILKTCVKDLEIRTNYLYSKNFTFEMISRIFSRNPFWLLFSTHRIDNRLGFFQQIFDLSGNELRAVAAKEPRIITCSLNKIKEMNFGFIEEMGFEVSQTKRLLLAKPKFWLMNKSMFVDRFDYLHNVIKMDHELMLQFPALLTCRQFRIKQRHEFLCHLGRAQYNQNLANYVNPLHLIEDTDAHFAVTIAKSSIQDFNDFCKTL